MVQVKDGGCASALSEDSKIALMKVDNALQEQISVINLNYWKIIKKQYSPFNLDLSKNYILNDTDHIDTQHNETLPLCWVSQFIYWYAEWHYDECC